MDLGLDEIIQRRKKNQVKRNRGKPMNGKGPARINAGGIKKRTLPGLLDARYKIIEKTRSKMVDARERLNQRLKQTDARERILRRTGASGVTKIRPEALPRRTIRNPIARMEPMTNYRITRPDPYGRPLKNGARGPTAYMDIDSEWNNRLASLPHLEVHLPRARDSPPTRSPIMQTSPDWTRKANPAMYRTKEDVKSRLEPLRQEGFRIVVSNLQPSVTHEDIKELFEDIGTLMNSRVVRPGTAEVVYKNMEDAVTAVDTYHNRQLDGQPMKCLLVKPRASSNPATKNIGTKGSIVPDLTTVHKALFMK